MGGAVGFRFIQKKEGKIQRSVSSAESGCFAAVAATFPADHKMITAQFDLKVYTCLNLNLQTRQSQHSGCTVEAKTTFSGQDQDLLQHFNESLSLHDDREEPAVLHSHSETHLGWLQPAQSSSLKRVKEREQFLYQTKANR